MRTVTTVEIDRQTHERLRALSERSGFRMKKLTGLLLGKALDGFAAEYPEFGARDPSGPPGPDADGE
jgi:hypothetical protein